MYHSGGDWGDVDDILFLKCVWVGYRGDTIDSPNSCDEIGSNPFVVGAGLSKTLRRSEIDNPMHKHGLNRLQHAIDELANEVSVCLEVLHLNLAINPNP